MVLKPSEATAREFSPVKRELRLPVSQSLASCRATRRNKFVGPCWDCHLGCSSEAAGDADQQTQGENDMDA